MDVTKQIRQLERLGFSGGVLDRAVAVAGSKRMVYLALCGAVEQQAMTPTEALLEVERMLATRKK